MPSLHAMCFYPKVEVHKICVAVVDHVTIFNVVFLLLNLFYLSNIAGGQITSFMS